MINNHDGVYKTKPLTAVIRNILLPIENIYHCFPDLFINCLTLKFKAVNRMK